MKNDYEKVLGSISLQAREQILGVVEKIIHLVETSPSSEPVYFERVTSLGSDGYDEGTILTKLKELNLVNVVETDDYGNLLITASLEKLREAKNFLENKNTEEMLKKQKSEQALRPTFFPLGRGEGVRTRQQEKRSLSDDNDFSDLPTSYLKQEYSAATLILAKVSYYGNEAKTKMMMGMFYGKYFPVPSSLGEGYEILARISEVVKKFENHGFIQEVSYGDGQMQNTTISFFVNPDNLRTYKTLLAKEIRLREGGGEMPSENKDILSNGQLSYDTDNREIKYGSKPARGLSTSSDYGRLLALLMGNINKRVSYTQICDAVGIDYKAEEIDPENDPSVKRQIQQIRKDLSKRLVGAGMPKSVLEELIVSRDGYKMNKID